MSPSVRPVADTAKAIRLAKIVASDATKARAAAFRTAEIAEEALGQKGANRLFAFEEFIEDTFEGSSPEKREVLDFIEGNTGLHVQNPYIFARWMSQ